MASLLVSLLSKVDLGLPSNRDEFGTPIQRFATLEQAYADPRVAGTATRMGSLVYKAEVLRDGTTGYFIYLPKFSPIDQGAYNALPANLRAQIPYEWSGDLAAPISSVFGTWPAAVFQKTVLGWSTEFPTTDAYGANITTWVRGTGSVQWLPYCGWGRWANQKSRIDGSIGKCEVRSDMWAAAVTVVREAGKVVGQALRIVAPAIGLIPGIGSGVAVALSVAGSLAMGAPLDEAVIDAASQVIPGGPIAKEAFMIAATAGKGVIEGKPFDQIALSAAREALPGGDAAKAAFDAGIAIAQGKNLQDAGWAALKAWAKGNDFAEQVATFTDAMATAAQIGQTVKQVLATDIVKDVYALGSAAYSKLEPLVSQLVDDPSLLGLSAADLAAAYGVAEPIARAALAMVAVAEDGTIGVDEDLGNQIRVGTSLRDRIANAQPIATSSPAIRQRQELLQRYPLRLSFKTIAKTATFADVPAIKSPALQFLSKYDLVITKGPHATAPTPTAPSTPAPAPVKATNPNASAAEPEESLTTELAIAGGVVALVAAGTYWYLRRA